MGNVNFKMVVAGFAGLMAFWVLLSFFFTIDAGERGVILRFGAVNRVVPEGIHVITDFEFSPEFNRAIESKQTAEQLALKAKRDLDRIKVEAQQKIATAQAEAEALRSSAAGRVARARAAA